MSENAIPLDQIQKWMQSVITHPEGVVVGVASPEAQREIPVAPQRVEDVVTRSQSLTSWERLQIYGNAYYARLVECLHDEFPAVFRALGEETFDAFAMGYLQSCPSQSYTLAKLGASFPRFLAELPPLSTDAIANQRANFVSDLAALERIYGEVFDGPGIEDQSPLTPDSLTDIPPEAWPKLKIIPVPCLRLAAFRFPVHEYITAVRHEESAEIPGPSPTHLAISRRDFVVRRLPLSPLQFKLLSNLVSGVPLADAIELTLENTDADLEDFAAQLQSWFQEWTASQLFLGVKSADDSIGHDQ